MKYVPHAICLLYDWPLIISLIVGNVIVAVSYFAIPVGLYKHSRAHGNLPLPFSRRILLLFSCFIFACGMTHVMQVVTLFLPWYWIDAIVVVITALLSFSTAYIFVPEVWRLIKTPPAQELAQARDSIVKANSARRKQASLDGIESDFDHEASIAMNDALARIDQLLKQIT